MLDYRKMAEEIFLAGVAAVLPDKLIREQVRLENEYLTIGKIKFDLRQIKNIYVVGAGKASAIMAKEIEAILGDRITEGHVITRYGHGCKLNRIALTEADHPTPDANGIKGTAKILHLVKKAAENDLVLCLLSGGGSALMADYPDGGQLSDLIKINQLLVGCGADISEINIVRKHLSNVKGGLLAREAQPGRMVTLILSDVPDDRLDVIASGPTVPDPSTFQDALDVVKKFALEPHLPPPLLKHLADGVAGRIPETPKEGDPLFKRTRNIIIGNNHIALQASLKKAIALGFETKIASTALSGDSTVMANAIINDASAMQKHPAIANDICLLLGGETTIKVTGHGLGGRNQHLALAAAIELEDKPGITMLSAGTDGTDGPTDATGAVVDSQTILTAKTKGIDTNHCLQNFDSYHFFKNIGGQIITGPTRTNVMDIVVVIVKKPPRQ
jgi:glycerate 2-kinase